MARTEAEVREKLAALGKRIRLSILEGFPVHVRYCPGNGTAYNLLFTPSWVTHVLAPGEMADAVMFPPETDTVLLSSDHGFYPWRWDHAPHVDYVAEKWARGRHADGAALVLLLAAISETEAWCSLADADIHVAYEARA